MHPLAKPAYRFPAGKRGYPQADEQQLWLGPLD